MDAEGWAPGERGKATLLATVMLAAMLYPLRQHLRSGEKRADGFPLSYYPMFSARRRQHANINYVAGVLADDSRVYLPHRLLGVGGLNQVRRQLNRVVREERAEDFVVTLAARAALEPGLEDVVRVEIVRGEFDLDNCMLNHQIDGTETVIAGADVVRVAGVSGTRRAHRAGLDQALAALWPGSILTVTKFDRFARDVADAHTILTDLSERGVLFGLGASVYDWKDPFGRLFLQTLAMVAEFEANIGHLRTREGMAKARRQGKLRGKQPKLPPSAARAIRRRYADGEVSLADLAEEYSVGRSTIHRIIHRPEPDAPTTQT